MNIGYWGIPGTNRSTIVHIQEHGQRTLCGYTMSEKYEFQWCARMMDRLYIHRYVECKECKKRIIRMMEIEFALIEARIPKKEPKKRNRATQARDTKEAAACADRFMNLTRCIGGHVLASGLVCPHCDSYDPDRECYKEKINLNKEGK